MRYLLLVTVFVFLGCKSEPKVEDVAANKQKAYVLNTEDIEKIDYTDYVLSPDSEAAIVDWQKYQDLQSQMELLKKANLSFFKVEKNIMQEFINELKGGQPETVSTPAIRSRMTVLETNLLRLQDLANLDNIKKNELLEAVKDLLVADVNLKLQMNKKFEKQAQQIQLPLK